MTLEKCRAWQKKCSTSVLSVFILVLLLECGSGEKVYTHDWAVQVEGGIEVARGVAEHQNCEVVDQVSWDY